MTKRTYTNNPTENNMSKAKEDRHQFITEIHTIAQALQDVQTISQGREAFALGRVKDTNRLSNLLFDMKRACRRAETIVNTIIDAREQREEDERENAGPWVCEDLTEASDDQDYFDLLGY